MRVFRTDEPHPTACLLTFYLEDHMVEIYFQDEPVAICYWKHQEGAAIDIFFTPDKFDTFDPVDELDSIAFGTKYSGQRAYKSVSCDEFEEMVEKAFCDHASLLFDRRITRNR